MRALFALLGFAAVTQSGLAFGAGRLHQGALGAPKNVEVFVQLATPSVAEANATALRETGALLDSAVQREHATRISQEQAAFGSRLRGMGLRPTQPQRVGANGMRVVATAADIAALRAMPDVRSVGRVERHVLDNIDSVPWIGAPEVWASGFTGKGIRIGIIDTGIDYLHANFGADGDPAAYAANDPNVVEPGTFPTAKVVGGHDFAGATYDADDPTTEAIEDNDPLDVVGHGSHVAGTAAGSGVSGSIGSGVAPDAKLYALKVFSDAGGSTELTSLAIEWAMDPNRDGDMSDHLDVINMSLGAPLGNPGDPSAISSNNAAAVGIVVVTSAGNEGNVPYIVGAPGVASEAISTAAIIPGGRTYARFTVNTPPALAGTYPSEEGAGPVTFEETGPITDALIPAVPRDGCAPLTNAGAVAGNIALIIRGGTCGFLDKYLAAQNAGARAIVVYNDGTAPDRIDPIVMGGLDNTVTIPGLMISFTVGNVLAATPGVTVTIDTALDEDRDDRMTDFSSRGPGQGRSTFKPDLSAPGFSIVSTGVGTGTGSENLQGTSMASPHVAGAAALLLDKWGQATPKAIKALLQNSTVPANESGDTDVARQGVGVIRVDRAIGLASYATPGGVSFGRVNRVVPTFRTEAVELQNLRNAPRVFTVQHVPGQTYPGVRVECPARVAVGAKRSNDFRIRLFFDPSAALEQGVFDNASISQTEVDGWCVLSDGKDALRVAYLAVVDPASFAFAHVKSGGKTVTVTNIGPSVALAEGFTWDADGGEIAAAQGKPQGLQRVGYRTADPALYFDEPVIEFGIATDAAWEHISNLRFDFFLDVDNNGTDDVHLVAADLSEFEDVDPGDFVTAQFDVGADGNLDWFVTTWDFNDRVVILPFTKVGGTFGRVPAAFRYRLEVSGSDGIVDVHHGRINTANEIGLDLNSFGLDPFDSADVHITTGDGRLLWLYPNNTVAEQAQKVGPVSAR
jgi:minor extracellular serine protease Vpr